MCRFLQNSIIPYAGWCHSFKMSWIFKHFVSLRRESITSQSTQPCWPKQTPQTQTPQRRPPPDPSLLETPGRLGKIAYPSRSYMICICISVVKNQSVCHYSWGLFKAFLEMFFFLFFVDKVLPSSFWFPYSTFVLF